MSQRCLFCHKLSVRRNHDAQTGVSAARGVMMELLSMTLAAKRSDRCSSADAHDKYSSKTSWVLSCCFSWSNTRVKLENDNLTSFRELKTTRSKSPTRRLVEAAFASSTLPPPAIERVNLPGHWAWVNEDTLP